MAEPGKRRENGSGLDPATAGALAVGTGAIATGAALARSRNATPRGVATSPAEVMARLRQANAGGFERLIAQGRNKAVLGTVDSQVLSAADVAGKTNKIATPSIPKGTTRLIHNHPRITDVARGGGFSPDDLAFATDRFKGNFHVLSDEGSLYSMRAGRNAPKTSYGVDKLMTRHHSMTRAMVADLKAKGVVPYEARIAGRSAAARVLAKEGVITYREVLRGSEKAAVATHADAINKMVAQHMVASRSGGIATTITKTAALTTPVAAASVAALAYKAARDAGKSEARATVEAAGAGMATAAMPAAVGAAAAKLGKVHSVGAKVLGVASRALLPASVIGHAGAYAYAAIQRGEGLADVAKAAGWGAVNGVIPVDLAMDAYHATVGRPSAPSADPSRRSSASGQLDAGNEASFKRADADFRQRWSSANGADKQPGEKGKGETRKGWANPSVQRSAQEARGVQNFSDWAEKVPQ